MNFIFWRPHVQDHLTDYFVLGSPECKSSAILVNSQLVCLSLVRIHNPVKCDVNCFRRLLGPTSISSINTAEGKLRLFILFMFVLVLLSLDYSSCIRLYPGRTFCDPGPSSACSALRKGI